MDHSDFLNACCSLDLETNENGVIYAIAAVFKDQIFQRRTPFNIHKVLTELDAFIQEADYLLGHNILRHDLPVCRAIKPDLEFLNKPAIDTLFLSPLAFPENPYHRLVKDYKLVRDSINDPLTDARLATALFQDQWLALSDQHNESGLLSFYHFGFAGDVLYSGLQAAFKQLSAITLTIEKAQDLFKQLTDNRVCSVAVDRVLDQ